jgi:REP element-mobilizing transposase RayT
MSVRHQIPYKSGMFYITITCARWLPLFEKYDLYSVVYDWFDYLKRIGHYVNAFVIMPNHMHLILSFSHTEKSINKIIGDGIRFMSYSIIKRLTDLGATDVIIELQGFVNNTDRERNKRHEVFEPSFDWKLIESIHFMQQKLDYIHTNPLRTKIPLVVDRIDYVHSSALQYDKGIYYHCEVIPVQKMLDINLTGIKYGLE